MNRLLLILSFIILYGCTPQPLIIAALYYGPSYPKCPIAGLARYYDGSKGYDASQLDEGDSVIQYWRDFNSSCRMASYVVAIGESEAEVRYGVNKRDYTAAANQNVQMPSKVTVETIRDTHGKILGTISH